MSQYYIYQTNADYKFFWWEAAKESFSLNDYELVYKGELIDTIEFAGKTTKCNDDDLKILEKLFVLFNTNCPEDYKARSLSVSDIIAIKRKDMTRYYYCNDIGWQLVLSETNE